MKTNNNVLNSNLNLLKIEIQQSKLAKNPST